ncbi:MAG: hypothetical protein CR994_03880 [Maribacter sp.]|nr:MAG: hypothetical protein CR994_03880 [Maribacter sp.]
MAKSLVSNGRKAKKEMTVQVLSHLSGHRTLKSYIVANGQGGIIDFMTTKGNLDDRRPLHSKAFIKKLYGEPFGHRGHADCSNNLFPAFMVCNSKDKKPSLKRNFIDTQQLYLALW